MRWLLVLLLLWPSLTLATDFRDPVFVYDQFNLNLAAPVASAATVDIYNIPGNLVHITGTVTITAFANAGKAGAERTVIFDGALTLTHGASAIVLPGGANITTAAGDVAVFVSDNTTGKWICKSYRAAAISQAELAYLDGLTPGTVAASKAVVVNSSKDATQFGTLGADIVRAGAASRVGAVEVYSATASSGKLNITQTGNSTDNTTTLTNDAHGQTTVTHLGDPGVAASYLMQSATELGLIDLTAAELDALDGNGTGVTVVDGVQATLTTDMTAANGDITLTAVSYTKATGEAVTITYVKAGFDTALSIDVDGSDITVNLATGADPGTVTSTALEIKTAFDLVGAATALATMTVEGDGSGVANDATIAAAPLAGGVDVTPGSVGSWRFKADGSEGYVKTAAQVWKKFALAGL